MSNLSLGLPTLLPFERPHGSDLTGVHPYKLRLPCNRSSDSDNAIHMEGPEPSGHGIELKQLPLGIVLPHSLYRIPLLP